VAAGLDDLSMEEVRLNAYEAKASGNLSAYVGLICYFSVKIVPVCFVVLYTFFLA